MRSVRSRRCSRFGIVGMLKRTSARRLPPLFDMTLRSESEPLLSDGLPESIQASAVAVSVCCVPQFTCELWTLHV